jgi:hypothetical protein
MTLPQARAVVAASLASYDGSGGYWLTPMCGLTASTRQVLGTTGLLSSFNCAARGLLSMSTRSSTRNCWCRGQTSQRLMNCSTSTTSSAAVFLGRARRLLQRHSVSTGAEEAQDFSRYPTSSLAHMLQWQISAFSRETLQGIRPTFLVYRSLGHEATRPAAALHVKRYTPGTTLTSTTMSCSPPPRITPRSGTTSAKSAPQARVM